MRQKVEREPLDAGTAQHEGLRRRFVLSPDAVLQLEAEQERLGLLDWLRNEDELTQLYSFLAGNRGQPSLDFVGLKLPYGSQDLNTFPRQPLTLNQIFTVDRNAC